MLSPATIAELCRRQARLAARHKHVPLVVEAEDKQSGDRLARHLRGIPNIGSYRPKGWTLVATHFVDKTGLGRRDEPRSRSCSSWASCRLAWDTRSSKRGCFRSSSGPLRGGANDRTAWHVRSGIRRLLPCLRLAGGPVLGVRRRSGLGALPHRPHPGAHGSGPHVGADHAGEPEWAAKCGALSINVEQNRTWHSSEPQQRANMKEGTWATRTDRN